MQTNLEVNYDAMFEKQVLAILANNGFKPAEDPEPYEVAASMGMSEEELDFELEKGMRSVEAGRVIPHKKVWAKFGFWNMELFYTKEADQDLIDIYNYIAKDNEFAARSYVQKIKSRAEFLLGAPNFGKRYKKYKYILAENHKIYFLPQKNDVINIIRVLHGRMDHTKIL